MYGVRGFADPNIGIQSNGLNLLYQPSSASTDTLNGTKYLLPYQLQGARAGCTAGGSNAWTQNHNALNGGLNNNWPNGNAPASMGYLNRSQIPFLYELADAFLIHDMYFQSVIGPTNPNRVVWMSGTNTGAPSNYVLEDNTESVPFQWTTYPQVLTNANITWQLYQDTDNFDDNPLAWFQYWQNLPSGTEKNKGLGYLGLQGFYDAAGNGTLPQFSIIVGPTELSEHPDNTPLAGSWLQQQVVNAVMNSPKWNETALIINYDESGGFFDHVIPPLAPSSEYVTDKFVGGQAPIGYGPRVPLMIVSPWTRGGYVFSETSDHTSTIQFLEEWVGRYANGSLVAPCTNISPFHRNTSSNLVDAFDFNNPDYSIPTFSTVAKPAQILGKWDPTEMCEALITSPKTTPPYGKQKYPVVESGSRAVRGAVTEGRLIALTTSSSQVVQVSNSTLQLQALTKRDGVVKFNKNSLFSLQSIGNGAHVVKSAADPSVCINISGSSGLQFGKCSGTAWYFEKNSNQYHLRESSTNSYLAIDTTGVASLQASKKTAFQVHSVTQ